MYLLAVWRHVEARSSVWELRGSPGHELPGGFFLCDVKQTAVVPLI
jgi:hypothetical protein